MKNRILETLVRLGICENESIMPFFPKVRDREDVSVLKCKKSGVLFLSGDAHIETSYYDHQDNFNYWEGAKDRKTAVLNGEEDLNRRFEQFKSLVINKKWLDVGTGAGGILDLLKPFAACVLAVEPQQFSRTELCKLGYSVYPDIQSIPFCDVEIVTLFHVFEHFVDPIESLKLLRSKMQKGGKIVIEVPHARDFLLDFLDLEDFKSFTLWSEHLILHTRASLKIFLEAAGFSSVQIQGFQRYPLANHLHWLAKGRPGGHNIWGHLRSHALDNAYGEMLARLDCTDSLIAFAQNE